MPKLSIVGGLSKGYARNKTVIELLHAPCATAQHFVRKRHGKPPELNKGTITPIEGLVNHSPDEDKATNTAVHC